MSPLSSDLKSDTFFESCFVSIDTSEKFKSSPLYLTHTISIVTGHVKSFLFLILHLEHSVCLFVMQSVPPLDNGRIWSMANFSVDPHHLHLSSLI
jgi:hypothetical protein